MLMTFGDRQQQLLSTQQLEEQAALLLQLYPHPVAGALGVDMPAWPAGGSIHPAWLGSWAWQLDSRPSHCVLLPHTNTTDTRPQPPSLTYGLRNPYLPHTGVHPSLALHIPTWHAAPPTGKHWTQTNRLRCV